MNNAILVMGIGSYNGDDQVGWRVIDQLRERYSLQRFPLHALQLKTYRRPGIEFLQDMQGMQQVLIIDALQSGAVEGSIRRISKEQLLLSQQMISTHGCGVAEMLILQENLESLPENIELFGIEICQLQPNGEVSLRIQNAAMNLANQLEQLLLEKLCYA